MSWLGVLGVAVGLAMDALAVAIAAGMAIPQLTRRHLFRLSFHFGLFQFLMPLIGWCAGRSIQDHISGYDHWVAFLMLTGIGLKMLWEAWFGHDDTPDRDPTRGWSLVALSIATSIDALAVGLSLAFMRVPIWSTSIVIGLVAAAATGLGMHFGSRLGCRLGRIAETTGGMVLVAIGTRILALHLI